MVSFYLARACAFDSLTVDSGCPSLIAVVTGYRLPSMTDHGAGRIDKQWVSKDCMRWPYQTGIAVRFGV